MDSCLKLYCQCFALSTTCGPKCKCQTCNNTTLHADAIDEARKTILERNPSAFDDKFRGQSPSPYRPVYSPPATATTPSWAPTSYATAPAPKTKAVAPVAHPAPPPTMVVAVPRIASGPPPRVNKYGCKCRRSFCLKKVQQEIRPMSKSSEAPCGLISILSQPNFSVVFLFFSIANVIKIPFIVG
jgi:hypothetical protein